MGRLDILRLLVLCPPLSLRPDKVEGSGHCRWQCPLDKLDGRQTELWRIIETQVQELAPDASLVLAFQGRIWQLIRDGSADPPPLQAGAAVLRVPAGWILVEIK